MSGNWVTDIHGVNVLRKREIASSPPSLKEASFSAAASFANAPALCCSRLSSGLQGLQVYHCTASSRNRILLSNKSRTSRDLWLKHPLVSPFFETLTYIRSKFKWSKAKSAFFWALPNLSFTHDPNIIFTKIMMRNSHKTDFIIGFLIWVLGSEEFSPLLQKINYPFHWYFSNP